MKRSRAVTPPRRASRAVYDVEAWKPGTRGSSSLVFPTLLEAVDYAAKAKRQGFEGVIRRADGDDVTVVGRF